MTRKPSMTKEIVSLKDLCMSRTIESPTSHYHHINRNFDILSVIIHFSDVTLLFEQWIIFKNLQFILLFLIIWTLIFYCFMLKTVQFILWNFRESNHYWGFSSLLWLSKLPSNHSATATTLLYSIISTCIYDSW
jgi:hypothetical protein